MFKIKEVEFLGRKVSIVTHGPSGPCPLTALGAPSEMDPTRISAFNDQLSSWRFCSREIRMFAESPRRLNRIRSQCSASPQLGSSPREGCNLIERGYEPSRGAAF